MTVVISDERQQLGMGGEPKMPTSTALVINQTTISRNLPMRGPPANHWPGAATQKQEREKRQEA